MSFCYNCSLIVFEKELLSGLPLAPFELLISVPFIGIFQLYAIYLYYFFFVIKSVSNLAYGILLSNISFVYRYIALFQFRKVYFILFIRFYTFFNVQKYLQRFK